MTSKEVWNLVGIFFRYMSPVKYIILYDHKARTISINTTNKQWFFSQASLTVFAAILGVYFLLNPNSEYMKNVKSLRTVGHMFGILYAGIIGLYAVFTISVKCRGYAFYCCFNTVIGLQTKLQSKHLR